MSSHHLQYTLGLNQRWCEGRSSYRPSGELIRVSEYEVAEIADDNTARAFVLTHHYSRSYPAARFRYGLYRHGNLVGVAVFSHPCSDSVLSNVFAMPARLAVELGRFVLLDEIPGNSETWFLGRTFSLLRSAGIEGVVSFSDPQPRVTVDGTFVHLGHVGTIYQAHNGIYLGRGTARTLRILPDGRVFSDRAAQKVRAGERGWRYAAALLERWGALPAPEDKSERETWLRNCLTAFTVRARHQGNHKYAWPLNRRVRSMLPESLWYPKVLDAPVSLGARTEVSAA